MDKAKQEYQSYVSDYFRRGAMREMGDEERQTIIDGWLHGRLSAASRAHLAV